MAMSAILSVMIIISVIYGAATGSSAAVGDAMMEGAKAAITLVISIGGIVCLWSGVMELMRTSGAAASLSRFLRPALKLLFPSASTDKNTMDALSQNVSANMLGLGNAATPAGIRAAAGMLRLSGGTEASNELCRLVVMNTASIQLLPTTVAAVRAQAGAVNPFDILPAVWISSVVALTAGLVCSKLLEGRSR